VLYIHAEASRQKVLSIAAASLDRLGVCNRLNLCLVDRGAAGLVPDLLELFASRGIEVRDELGREWANDPNPSQVTVCHVESLEEAVRVANEETSGLAAGIVTEDPVAAQAFLDGCRGTAAFWNATTRFTDGFALTGAPETGINVDWTPGPRGPVTYRDLWLRQYRVVGDGTQAR
jgi:glutamate-5-semialdehyde dehydrogenase